MAVSHAELKRSTTISLLPPDTAMTLPSPAVIKHLDNTIHEYDPDAKDLPSEKCKFFKSFLLGVKSYLSTEDAKTYNFSTGLFGAVNAVMSTWHDKPSKEDTTTRLTTTAAGSLLMFSVMITGSILKKKYGSRARTLIDENFIKRASGFSNAFRFSFEVLCQIVTYIPGSSSNISMGAVLGLSTLSGIAEYIRQTKSASTPPSKLASTLFFCIRTGALLSGIKRIYENSHDSSDTTDLMLNITTYIATFLPALAYKKHIKPDQLEWLTTINNVIFDIGTFAQAIKSGDKKIIGILLGAKLIPHGVNQCFIQLHPEFATLINDPRQQLLAENDRLEVGDNKTFQSRSP